MAVLSSSNEDAQWVRYGSAPLIVTLVLPIVIGVILLLKCVFNHCCVRRTTTKEEIYGVEGRMTILSNAESPFLPFPPSSQTPTVVYSTATTVDSNSNHQYLTPDSITVNKVDAVITCSNNVSNPESTSIDSSGLAVEKPKEDFTGSNAKLFDPPRNADSLKRNSTTTLRQLPELPQIPIEGQTRARRSSSINSHDGTSDLYATVGDFSGDPCGRNGVYAQIGRPNVKENGSLPGSSAATDVNKKAAFNNEATPSSDSETYATAGASDSHAYAKLRRHTEHPYARVRRTSNGVDEETDTDTYDTQPYAESGPSRVGLRLSSSGNVAKLSTNIRGSSSSGAENSNQDTTEASGPVPPRRVGRHWRRSSHPTPNPNFNPDEVSNFSGDSQDSRGYTSISVREPLSNLRSQIPLPKPSDSLYATLSDDSEEMYAAIEDASYAKILRDGNDMRSRLGGAHLVSPIPERREANSPLPPVPMVPPPDKSPGTSSLTTATLPAPSATLPVYAQVNKKKKGKAPVTPTLSSESTSSQPTSSKAIESTNSHSIDNNNMKTTTETSTGPVTVVHRSRHAAKLMDSSNVNPSHSKKGNPDCIGDSARRWSKADISYFEFEIVRENLTPDTSTGSISDIAKTSSFHGDLNSSTKVPSASFILSSPDNRSTIPTTTTTNVVFPPVASPSNTNNTTSILKSNELLDEDNYNVIPEPNHSKRAAIPPPPPPHIDDTSMNSYQELEPISNPYHEIGENRRQESGSDHYQEIGARSSIANGPKELGNSSNLYHEITKSSKSHFDGEYEDDDDDDEDDFYEKVKPATTAGSKRKHGYEKLKKKPSMELPLPSVNVVATSSNTNVSNNNEYELDDDEDEDGKDGDSLYEKVRYPPYERLKESRSDLAVFKDGEAEEDEEDSDGNLYEAIGYSKVKPKKKEMDEQAVLNEFRYMDDDKSEDSSSKVIQTVPVNVDQLYARVDKSKKKKSSITTTTGVVDDSNSRSENVNNYASTSTQISNTKDDDKDDDLSLEDDESENAIFNSIEYI